MRKGSSPLGSLGPISWQIAVLILPLAACAPGAMLGSQPCAAEEILTAPRAEEHAELAALRRRAAWPEKPVLLASRGGKTVRKSRPTRVIHTGATWYGPGFHGRRTASGERFNRNAMTLASRHLPMGTRVRVVNPATGKSAVARVNDRGPFGKKGYTADLSQALARRIGLRSSGRVRLEILPK